MSTDQEVEAALAVLGALAYSIRVDWSSGVSDRMEDMQTLVSSWLNLDDPETRSWLDWLRDRENIEECEFDGRHMRHWPGPYGGKCTYKQLRRVGFHPWDLGEFADHYIDWDAGRESSSESE